MAVCINLGIISTQTKTNLETIIDYKGILYVHSGDRIKLKVNQVNCRIHQFLQIILKILTFPKVNIIDINCLKELFKWCF